MCAQLSPRVVYIAGLSRGGSTILQRYLSTHPGFISVGESHFTLRVLTGEERVDPAYPCSCGRTRHECELWGPLITPFANATLEGAHRLLLERFQELHPHEILIDSSKETTALKRFYLPKAHAGEIDLRVILLVRDVRSWASAVRKYRSGGSSFVLEAYRWMKATLNMLRVLRSTGVPTYCLSYESFIFDPAKETEALAQWLGVADHFSVDRLAQAATHELFGSPTARLGAGKLHRLVYDDSWLRDWQPALLGPLLRPPLLLNRYVYRSLAGRPIHSSPPPDAPTR
jgi:hypothetical protein